ncbi:beta-lactamase [Pseudomassariella vexata]|uniref:Beta-lactamase n=1 Tax=Pseudomassariella vexata TaxID=1141098 RepID=A0A1Y2DVG2_9PEZI|nr:beta-lactamase [Pseudomassariella vexata]ORY63282.1 beta-lactamase [Pseudomassariella vexata]
MGLCRLLSVAFLAFQLVCVNSLRANCPYQGPAFPKPTSLKSSDTIRTALANITQTFISRDSEASTNPNGTSWSIQIFAASDDEPIWEHYHTAPTLRDANTGGVKEVDGDTIYRVGSLTKIFTIATYLKEVGDETWNSPVTKYVPELEALAAQAESDPIMKVDWGDITLGALAAHMAGIVRDYAIVGELTQENNQSSLIAQGFPPAPVNDTPTCGEWPQCSREEFFAGLSNIPPSFAPSQTAGYSNAGYQILAYALESITGKKFPDMLQANIIDKLGLNHTYYQKPSDDLGVLPPNSDVGWSYSLGEASPTGNLYSSVNDLSRLGRAIFRNTLMSAAQTRRWLKPAALTSDLYAGVGYPWGVRRIPLGSGLNNGNRIVDAYGKAGSINVYSSLLVLVPDYDVGITALLAGAWPGNANWAIADAIGAVLIPALEETARLQAEGNFGGTYTSGGGDNTENSTLTLSTTPDRPGLGVERWISNGTDMWPVAIRYTLGYNVTNAGLRLYPTGIETTSAAADGMRKLAFKLVVEDLGAVYHDGVMFSTNCGGWVSQTTAVYADMPLDQFVFTVNASGIAVSVETLALRANLTKS